VKNQPILIIFSTQYSEKKFTPKNKSADAPHLKTVAALQQEVLKAIFQQYSTVIIKQLFFQSHA